MNTSNWNKNQLDEKELNERWMNICINLLSSEGSSWIVRYNFITHPMFASSKIHNSHLPNGVQTFANLLIIIINGYFIPYIGRVVIDTKAHSDFDTTGVE